MLRSRLNVKSRKLETPSYLPERSGEAPIVRRPDWNEDYTRQVFYLALLGLNNVQIGQVFGVSVNTVEHWIATQEGFGAAIEEGKAKADAEVAHSLYMAAKGYTCPDVVVLTNRKRTYNDKGRVIEEKTEPLLVETVKHYPPNVTAAIKWLSVRQPGIWKEDLDINLKGNISNNKVETSDLTLEELQMLKTISNTKQEERLKNTVETSYVEV